MEIIVCTENRAKVQAITEVFSNLHPEANIISKSFSSDISDQPMSEEEGLDGAINRANNARREYLEAHYCIGMEGFVDVNKFGMFLAGAVAIIDQQGIIGLGTSAKVLLPKFIAKEIEAGVELGPLVKDLMDDVKGEIRHSAGTTGVLTKGLYNRVDEFKDATKCALARFQSPKLFEIQ
ncbi:DUF84 family protein [Candidatus Uhrbacteria bacterium]|jgi:inosine/xanthosine triphosphatase|nr:DUF84 family protein [Candidatus Uhrbacteria bacterium]MBT7717420.1 DUF84 family protein [Candidatus Uhrbacteria bacterium]